jgi:scyllo-inositol 2-dehydrogenase (NADP+)
MVRVGLIGFGLAGQSFHAPIIRSVPGLELACILERRGSLAHQKYPEVRIARTLEDLLTDEQMRLCVIATPNASHFDLARRCLLAGRDVVIDKPFATNSGDALQLIELAEKNGRLLTVYQNRRLDGDFLTVRKLLASGVLGRVVSYESHYDRFRPVIKENVWRERAEPGSGILFDLSPHLVDQALVLFGTPLAIGAGVFSERAGSEVDDAFDVRFEYPEMHAYLRASMMACAARPHFVLQGTKGSFVKYGMDPQEAILRRSEPPGGPHWGEEPEADWGTLWFPNGDSRTTEKLKTEAGDYRLFYVNVRDAITEGKPLAVPAREALQTVRAIEFVQQSSLERRTIPWSDFSG